MASVAQILKNKPNQGVLSIAPDAKVFDALQLMSDRNVGALLVMERGQVIGIVSERDYARKMILTGRSSRDTQVRDIMSAPVRCVRPDAKNEECMALMTEHRLRHLPVVREDDGELLGVVSIGDLVKDIISEQQFLIEQLEHYIAGHSQL